MSSGNIISRKNVRVGSANNARERESDNPPNSQLRSSVVPRTNARVGSANNARERESDDPPNSQLRSSVVSRTNARVGSANTARERESDNPPNSQLRSSVVPANMPNRLSMFRRIHARMSWIALNIGAPESVFQAQTVRAPPEGRPGLEMSVWSHGLYKCAMIRRPDVIDDVLRVKMYESFASITIFIPHDFNGIVGRVGHSGRSIACSPAALFLKECNSLRFDGVPDATEDLVLVRTEKVLHVCVAGQDPPLPRRGRLRRPHV